MVSLFPFLLLWKKIPWQRNLVEKEERFVWLTIPGYSPSFWEHQGRSSLKQVIRSCPSVRAEGNELINMWYCSLTFSLLNNPECRPREKWHLWLKGLHISIIKIKTTFYRHTIGTSPPLWVILDSVKLAVKTKPSYIYSFILIFVTKIKSQIIYYPLSCIFVYIYLFMYICGHLCINVVYKMTKKASAGFKEAERGLTGTYMNSKWVTEIVRNITKEPSWRIAGGAEPR